MRSSTRVRAVIYAVLIAGAIVFAFPFVWLASTSMKLDRELFSGRIDVAPERPHPRLRSPYYNERHFHHVELTNPQIDALRPLLHQQISIILPTLPTGDCSGDQRELILAGLFDSLSRRAPQDIWSGDKVSLLRFAQQDTTADQIKTTAAACFRELGIGSLRARSESLAEIELTGAPISNHWHNRSSAVAQLTDRIDASLPYAAIEYDFSQGDRIELEQTFELPFDASELQRIQLRIRPDDTWHQVRIQLDTAGVRYESARPIPLADSRWTTMTWQMPSSDDDSTKIRTWVLLNPTARGPQFAPGTNSIRIVVTIDKVSVTEAMFAKARYNYHRVLEHMPFWRYVRVSIVLVVLNIVLVLLSSSLVAYAFARLQWPGRDLMFLLLLGTMMIPTQVTMIPHFLIWKSVGAYDTLVPLWAGAALGNAFFIFLMRQFLRGIPRDLEDAARIDGCGFLRTWWHVMLPLVKPSLAAIAIFTFLGTWNDFMGPLIYIADQRLYPLAFGLYAFAVQVTSNPVLTMAASVLMTLPVLAVFFVAQRYFIQGITLTGMKG